MVPAIIVQTPIQIHITRGFRWTLMMGLPVGRTKVLAATMVLMALGTFAIGCIPSKALIELADAAQRTRDLHAAGLSAYPGAAEGLALELTADERSELERVSRAGSERADRVAHAKALLAVADGARPEWLGEAPAPSASEVPTSTSEKRGSGADPPVPPWPHLAG